MHERPHIIVVGAGPAGSAAAVCLARRGARVTLLDRARFPRDKVCGDGLTPRAVAAAGRLGVTLPAGQRAIVRGLHMVSPTGFVLDAPFPPAHGPEGAVIARRDLDHALVQRATACGAALREGVTVERVVTGGAGATVHCRGGEAIAGDVVLGCDGAPSIVRSSLGAPRFPDAHLCVAVRGYFEGVEPDRPDAFGVYWTEDLAPAYGWLFPLPGGRANVGVGLNMARLRARGLKVDALYRRFLGSRWMRRELGGARPLGPARGHLLPLGSFAHHLHFERALLLGDSAGFINPFSGEGIELAMESGEIAARTIERADRGGAGFGARALAAYGAECARRFASVFQINTGFERIFASPRLLDLTMKAAARSRGLRDALFDAAWGEARSPPVRALEGALRLLGGLRPIAAGG